MLFSHCFFWLKTGVFQQTVVRVYCILKQYSVTKIEAVMLTFKKSLKRQFKRGPAF